jgi:hypothetical protein
MSIHTGEREFNTKSILPVGIPRAYASETLAANRERTAVRRRSPGSGAPTLTAAHSTAAQRPVRLPGEGTIRCILLLFFLSLRHNPSTYVCAGDAVWQP